MGEAADDFALLRFSSDELPERDRLPITREVYGRSVVKLAMEPIGEVPLRLQLVARTLPGLTVASYSMSPMRGERTSELLADGNDDAVLCVSPCGGNIVTQLGRELTIAAGDAVLLSNSDSSSLLALSMSRDLNVAVPRKVLAAMVPRLEDTFLLPVPKDTEALKLLISYVAILEAHQALGSPMLRQAVVTHVYDLVALALGATRDVAEAARGRGVRAARLRAIKTDVTRESGDPNLNIGAIAALHRVTPRYVQLLFEGEGMTFSRFLLDQRLARAHHMLSHACFAEQTVTTIAFDAGFGDLSHFYRTFRRRYGEAPSDVRAGWRREREM
jgi:AraC-like DNA-binding protein